MAHRCMVFFPALACDLDAAAKSLAGYGLTVTRRGDELTAGRPGSPQFRIVLSAEPHVAVEAAKIGMGTPHEAAMRECGARFEVAIDDLDAALDEINTLMEVQGALQDASQGFLFLPWSGHLSEPWRE
ncbi:MAG: hypothetical protein IPH07_27495 [Deltaproteobacteria bacterium]|nr:hypothetical protein [Deltaproteobacteria bacterium]MBK8714638.1 hypothetical protein [Deltaproteobacteria bacterium]MBP7292208.1 hypothetical protein [Nannocystaceae bacterium]